MANGVRVGAIALVAVAAVFNVVGLATNNWFTFTQHEQNLDAENLDEKTYGGLWRECVKYIGLYVEECFDIPTVYVNTKLKAARGLTVLSSLLAGPSLLLLIVSMCAISSTMDYETRLPVIAIAFLFVQAICLAAGVGVGMKYAKDRGPSIDIYPDWSLGLAATASGLYFIAAILSVVSIYVAMT